MTSPIRPEDVVISASNVKGPSQPKTSEGLPATIRIVAPDALQQYQYLTLTSSAGEFIAKVHFNPDLREGQPVQSHFRVVHAFEREGGLRTDLPKEVASRFSPAA